MPPRRRGMPAGRCTPPPAAGSPPPRPPRAPTGASPWCSPSASTPRSPWTTAGSPGRWWRPWRRPPTRSGRRSTTWRATTRTGWPPTWTPSRPPSPGGRRPSPPAWTWDGSPRPASWPPWRRSAPGGSTRPALARGASLATAATQEFVAFLRTTVLPRARPTVAAGRDVYSVTARAFLGEDVDLDETYAWGWEELAALSAEMRQVAAALGHGSVEEAAAALDPDPAHRARPGTAPGLAAGAGGRGDRRRRRRPRRPARRGRSRRVPPRRRHLRGHVLHRPRPGLPPTGPDLVVPAGRPEPHLAGAHDRAPRGGARPPPPDGHRHAGARVAPLAADAGPRPRARRGLGALRRAPRR